MQPIAITSVFWGGTAVYTDVYKTPKIAVAWADSKSSKNSCRKRWERFTMCRMYFKI